MLRYVEEKQTNLLYSPSSALGEIQTLPAIYASRTVFNARSTSPQTVVENGTAN